MSFSEFVSTLWTHACSVRPTVADWLTDWLADCAKCQPGLEIWCYFDATHPHGHPHTHTHTLLSLGADIHLLLCSCVSVVVYFPSVFFVCLCVSGLTSSDCLFLFLFHHLSTFLFLIPLCISLSQSVACKHFTNLSVWYL